MASSLRAVASSGSREPERLLTVPEFADALTLKASTIRAWISSRRVAAVHLGRAVRIPASEVQRIVAEGTIPALPESR